MSLRRRTGAVAALHAAIPNAYYDREFDTHAIKILPGDYYVASDDLMLVTVLGSCVSACIRDIRLGVGGMNHFMLPETGGDNGPLSESARYGAYAMEVLVNELMKLGARRQFLEAKVFGGGAVIAGLTQANIGERNAAFVLAFLRDERISIAACDLLDVHPRRLHYFPRSGRVMMKKLRTKQGEIVLRSERHYTTKMRTHHVGGDVELFN